jgi:hypothetical protein
MFVKFDRFGIQIKLEEYSCFLVRRFECDQHRGEQIAHVDVTQFFILVVQVER